MIKIDPSRVLTDFDGLPLRTGEVKDSVTRLRLAEMKDTALRAEVGRQEVLLERYEQALLAAQAPLTLGTVLIRALHAPLDGDDKVDFKVKVERDDFCMTLYRAERDGKSIDLSAEQSVMLKPRVARLFTPRVVGQVVRYLNGKDEQSATQVANQ